MKNIKIVNSPTQYTQANKQCIQCKTAVFILLTDLYEPFCFCDVTLLLFLCLSVV
jgi:hypothetical protein